MPGCVVEGLAHQPAGQVGGRRGHGLGIGVGHQPLVVGVVLAQVVAQDLDKVVVGVEHSAGGGNGAGLARTRLSAD